jgi:hypothetical protein
MISSRLSSLPLTLIYPVMTLAIGFAIGFVLRSLVRDRESTKFQNQGEALLSQTLRQHFNTNDYHLLNHITLKHDGSTTQIDHILVSRLGVFVIETKNYNRMIFANANDETWTQATFKGKFKFQNPIRQNYRHVLATRELLDFVPSAAIHSVVVFVGQAEFKTDIPTGVYLLSQLIEYLKSFTDEVLTVNRVQFCVGRLETARLEISGNTDLEHMENLHRRYGQKP